MTEQVACVAQKKDVQAARQYDEMWMIVGFEVMPCSVKRTQIERVKCFPWPHEENPEPQPIAEGEDIVYSYDVFWEESDTRWASRWDHYLKMPSTNVHWFSILNSVLVVLVMSVLVAVILMRTVRRDLAKYEELLIEGKDSSKEDSGWKLLAGDVFRPPSHLADLAVQIGSGTQIFCTFLVTVVLAAAGFLSPAARGALLTGAIVLYLLLAITAGYASVLFWSNTTRSLEGWTGICLKTACYFPGASPYFILCCAHYRGM
jgi:transmembrane 9 superfamily member 2/4